MKKNYDLSIRCYYENGAYNTNHQSMKLTDISKWVEAYQFTHPNCKAVTVKVWLKDEGRADK